MSLLNVTVKRAKLIGDQSAQFNSYVTLKLQNVKTTTITVKGTEPCWEQDFLFETNTVNTGLLVEVWTKGMILDRVLGYQYITLDTLPYNQYDDPANYEQWYSIDTEQVMMNGEVNGTRDPTGHMLLLNLHFELPFDDTQPEDLHNNKMDTYNEYSSTVKHQAHDQYIENLGYSEDSDYTSDQNFPVNNHQNQHNLTTSQFRNLAATPLSSLETSRQNSYERDERLYYDINSYYKNMENNHQNFQQKYSPGFDNGDGMIDGEFDSDALYYNSRPMNSSSNYNRSNNHRNIRQLSKKNLERQNTLYEDDYEPQPQHDTCSEMNYNPNNDYSDYNSIVMQEQQWQNGDYSMDQQYGIKKSLPQPPMSCSQSVNDGFSHSRGASLPATPVSQPKFNQRQLPQHNNTPTHTQNFRGLPKLSRQLPPSIESAASTFSSIFNIGRTNRRKVPLISRTDTDQSDKDSIFSLPSGITTDIKNSIPVVSSADHTMDYQSYNENYNYAYQSQDSTDDIIIDEKCDGDNNNVIGDVYGSRLGSRLPPLPSYDNPEYNPYNSYLSETIPTISMTDPINTVIPIIDIHANNDDEFYYGDEYYDNTMYPLQTSKMETATGSPLMKSKRLPMPAYQAVTTTSQSSSSLISSITSSILGNISKPSMPTAKTFSSILSPDLSSTITTAAVTSTTTTTTSLFTNYHTTMPLIGNSLITEEQEMYSNDEPYMSGQDPYSRADNLYTNFEETTKDPYELIKDSYTLDDDLKDPYTMTYGSTTTKDNLYTKDPFGISKELDYSTDKYTTTNLTDFYGKSAYATNLDAMYSSIKDTSIIKIQDPPKTTAYSLTTTTTTSINKDPLSITTTSADLYAKSIFNDSYSSSKDYMTKEDPYGIIKDSYAATTTTDTYSSVKDPSMDDYMMETYETIKSPTIKDYKDPYSVSDSYKDIYEVTTTNDPYKNTISDSYNHYKEDNEPYVVTTANDPYKTTDSYAVTSMSDSYNHYKEDNEPYVVTTANDPYKTSDSYAITSMSDSYNLDSDPYKEDNEYDVVTTANSDSYKTSDSYNTISDPYKIDPYSTISDPYNTTSLYTSTSLLTKVSTTTNSSIFSSISTTSNQIFPTTLPLLTTTNSMYVGLSATIYDEFTNEPIEEYHEDYEEGVLPMSTSAVTAVISSDYAPIQTTSSITSDYTSTTSTNSSQYRPVYNPSTTEYYYQNSNYLMASKLSTIPETANDIYLSSTDLQGSTPVENYDEQQLTTPGGYDYTENENDYIASGDLKNTNILQNNYNQQQQSSQQQSSTVNAQPEQKKSLFGSFFNDGLSMIGSNISTIKATATNLAANVAAAATATMPPTTTTTTTHLSDVNKKSTLTKLHKQASEMYDEHNDNNLNSSAIGGYYDQHNDLTTTSTTTSSAAAATATTTANTMHDYFNEEEENRYLEEHTNSPSDHHHNHHHQQQQQQQQQQQHHHHNFLNNNLDYDDDDDEYLPYNNDNKNHIDNYNSYGDRNHKHNDDNNNSNDSSTNINDHKTDIINTNKDPYNNYDSTIDKTKTNSNKNNNNNYDKDNTTSDNKDRFNGKYNHNDDDNDVANDDYDEYGPSTMTNNNNKNLMHKQMSIIDDEHNSQHDDYELIDQRSEQNKLKITKSIDDDEYLDEFDENGELTKLGDTMNSYMKKQESIMEEDPELKQLEDLENLKHQQHLNQQHQDKDSDQSSIDPIDLNSDPDVKHKKTVTICENEIIHEPPPPREKRTAKQQWHWAYNKILHQSSVSSQNHFKFFSF